jgi:hypothetical protein
MLSAKPVHASILKRAIVPSLEIRHGYGITPFLRPGHLAHGLRDSFFTASTRHYAQPPNGAAGPGGGLPFNIFGQQHQKGEALKEYVSSLAMSVLYHILKLSH